MIVTRGFGLGLLVVTRGYGPRWITIEIVELSLYDREVNLTLSIRTNILTLDPMRAFGLMPTRRVVDLTLEPRTTDLTVEDRSTDLTLLLE